MSFLDFEPLSFYTLLGIGLALIGLEMTLGSFYILWIGIGFCLVAGVEYFIPFSSGLYQISLAFFIALVLLFLLKNRLKEFLGKNEKEIKDDFLNESGVGIIKHGLVEFKGTMWEIESKFKHLKDGTEVEVLKVEKNMAYLK